MEAVRARSALECGSPMPLSLGAPPVVGTKGGCLGLTVSWWSAKQKRHGTAALQSAPRLCPFQASRQAPWSALVRTDAAIRINVQTISLQADALLPDLAHAIEGYSWHPSNGWSGAEVVRLKKAGSPTLYLKAESGRYPMRADSRTWRMASRQAASMR